MKYDQVNCCWSLRSSCEAHSRSMSLRVSWSRAAPAPASSLWVPPVAVEDRLPWLSRWLPEDAELPRGAPAVVLASYCVASRPKISSRF